MSIPRDHYERLREYTALLELKQIELTAEQERLEKHHSEELRQRQAVYSKNLHEVHHLLRRELERNHELEKICQSFQQQNEELKAAVEGESTPVDEEREALELSDGGQGCSTEPSELVEVERYKLPAVEECPITIRELKENLHHVILDSHAGSQNTLVDDKVCLLKVELAKYERSIVNKWIEEERRRNLEQGVGAGSVLCLLAMPKGIEAVISSNKAKGFKLARLCGMFKAKRDETSTEDLLKRLACTKQRVQELQEWKVAFLAEWNLERHRLKADLEEAIRSSGEKHDELWGIQEEPEAEEEPWALDEELERQFDIRF
ncbi:hypothetical protein FOL46_004106 [Perkinsus olseni]|uniref:Uncharacterized protein n=1 Tax=Perkinsus olseni TaxID=32597 RepID=A0A7J6LZK9_PEROL|nr:hypothetical protein FOL46_004106 [Perkinsus olseni]